jgi:hypothetical protein
MNQLRELHQNATKIEELNVPAPEGYFRDPAGFLKPADGFSGDCVTVDANLGKTRTGNDSVGIQLETEDRIRFWANIYFTDGVTDNEKLTNAINTQQLDLFGIDEEFVLSEPSDDEVIAKIVGTSVGVRVKHDVQANGTVFLKVRFAPAGSVPPTNEASLLSRAAEIFRS